MNSTIPPSPAPEQQERATPLDEVAFVHIDDSIKEFQKFVNRILKNVAQTTNPDAPIITAEMAKILKETMRSRVGLLSSETQDIFAQEILQKLSPPELPS